MLTELAIAAVSAAAVAGPLTDPHVTTRFDRAAGQTPESIAPGPDGSVDVGLILSRQVARVSPSGRVRILATMPAPADGGVATPVTGVANVTGVERSRDGRTTWFLYSAGGDLTGLWRLRGAGVPERIAAFPASSFLNGLTQDDRTGRLYVTDSARGRIWTVSPRGGRPRVWARGRALAPAGFFGVNGIKVHRRAVWASNIDRGRILRIPITPRGTAGRTRVRATGLDGVDDFAFTGRGDRLLAALNGPDRVVHVVPGRSARVVLDARDGLDAPTAVAITGDTVRVASGALRSGGNANLLSARLR